ncbi:hypothetical protein ALC56_01971 [Trachymyrmex septentrionalis]|uniref:Uncharacterized protein n=1 Tax=Trachymyrmex septentrionalis TaxID=34720 RepID=A0A195FV14_9HYME|nr:hypothetical protein ALC56_01971 [Trachymyrmex septentrionalis]
MIQITICRSSQLQSTEADIIDIGNFGRWYYGKGAHNSIWILFSYFRDEQSAHSRSGTTTQGVRELKSLQAVTVFGFLPHYIEHRVHQFSTLGVMTLGPVVAGPRLTKHKVVWSKYLSKGPGTHRVHCAGFEIYQNRTRYIFWTGGFIVINVDPFQLKIGISVIGARRIDAMFIRNHLPKL